MPASMSTDDLVAIFATSALTLALVISAFYFRHHWFQDRVLCICHHRLNQHVRRLDYDSSVFEGPAKPGTCRFCLCRHYIAAL